MTQDLTTVHNAGTLEEADIVVAWLDDRGVVAIVKDRNSIGTFSGIMAVSHNTVEVCVVGQPQAEKACELLEKHFHGDNVS